MPRRIPTFRPRTPPHPRGKGPLYEYQRGRQEDKNFYCSSAWLRLRASFLASFPLCRPCKAKGVTKAAEHVHHVRPRKTHPDLALDWDNLESICQACHNALKVR
jgi:5-methylcytosine-specific restriction protein A